MLAFGLILASFVPLGVLLWLWPTWVCLLVMGSCLFTAMGLALRERTIGVVLAWTGTVLGNAFLVACCVRMYFSPLVEDWPIVPRVAVAVVAGLLIAGLGYTASESGLGSILALVGFASRPTR